MPNREINHFISTKTETPPRHVIRRDTLRSYELQRPEPRTRKGKIKATQKGITIYKRSEAEILNKGGTPDPGSYPQKAKNVLKSLKKNVQMHPVNIKIKTRRSGDVGTRKLRSFESSIIHKAAKKGILHKKIIKYIDRPKMPKMKLPKGPTSLLKEGMSGLAVKQAEKIQGAEFRANVKRSYPKSKEM